MEPYTHTCANCGAEKIGQFCSHCGQNSRNYLRGAHRILVELIVEIFDLESRLFRTLKYLVIRPGFLTAEFVAGRRASYLSPGRLYLVMSVIFFFLLSTMANVLPEGINLQMTEDGKNVELVGLSGSDIDLSEPEISSVTSSVNIPVSAEESESEWEVELEQKIEEVVADPGAGLAELIDNLPLMMFLLLPVYALLLQLFYFKSFYTQHLVFLLHIHSFMFLVFSIKLVLPDQDPGMIVSENTDWFADVWGSLKFALTIGSILYCYLALKHVYAQSYLKTGVKFLALGFGYFLLSGVGLVVALVLTLYYL